ncbi:MULTISPECIES: UDP-4-amino-4,6-dideoxy-N-acetyl-beta-L-altrosamine transaminase [Algoriphagus]|jgi:UDP-4-amino-4,6-dideoxy-N-acetyl-beta-L-altrosamine transaminase|uniref:UDP-4-amino-4, 6-dideoxy-N-acetyl-beta-L-altrosamine transaminase n=5 Tax=Cyclobacteriaceae TaxID=563798 RepID=UPI000C672624|nr:MULTISPECIES: UDP-4-amino-4,6-dideoxy-N-acetyl-beta-L-altrosamine transaminase [Algoriphagus]MAL13416.1 UDP-4-amino-4,6-dideoxy-N-acetyl-beta-L-altrosamine transaminase [Algoriphagus sp.]MAN87987.1 UDP-4-amino-4,6-dideoxy-N-acetyl-beta-L-altrosamine transaminase [Algoriphagus sp.]HAD52625.1 UDP-4-amino-4,6-dideoxy-N-acetyl-beta-L-altrosamine transaminase [Algoriphagus sp.]HCB45049.1 UDP-4-amino-4,6-dideoxy-N-acetyl-beta-L-altrosamine transaminase [Algoriphagus sp.]HCH45281.1 UDP-4-amino-4,6
MNPIPYGRQHITEDDILAVIETLKSDYLTQGPKIKEFEDAFASYVGSRYAIAVSNGTAALHLNALALGVKPGDKVITAPITFAASANCVRYCGGEVVFADIDPETYLLDIHSVRKLLEASPKGTYQGIIPVDFAGRAVDLEAFRELADEFGLWIIQDSCHSPGGYFIDSKGQKQHCGNGKFAELAIFSFHPVKHIASGEGGMITTNDENLYKKLLMLRTHGITRDESLFQNSLEFARGKDNFSLASHNSAFPAWYMEMQELGYNYRLTDFQAALGLSQLKRADEGLVRRKEIAKKYHEVFQGQPFIKSQSGVVDGHAYHLYIIEVENRLSLYQYLREQNIFAQIHYIPVHLMPYYRQFGWEEGDMPNAEQYYKNCISLPMYPTLTNEEQEFVIKTIIHFYGK